MTIGDGAFSDCVCDEISLPKATTVGELAFQSMASSTIRLPKAASIAADSFSDVQDCEIHLGSRTKAQVEAADFYGCTDTGTVFHCSNGDVSPA